jgi:hypothetical protein
MGRHLSARIRVDHLGVLATLIIMILLVVSRVAENSGWAGAGLFNLVYLFHCMMLISQGCRRVDLKSTTTGCLLLSLIAVTRYVDLFQSLVLRALVFLIIGAVVFAVGISYARAKRRSQEGAA